MDTGEMLQHALYYRNQGFSIIPVDGITKKPVVPWAEYQKRQASEEEVTKWWTDTPEADIGIVTGKISGITVVDAEKEADFELFDFPGTPCAETGGGGRHWYFAYAPMGNAVRFAPFYDLRGDGGYVIAPPSKHRSGGHYSWIIPIGEAPLAPFPTSLLPTLVSEKPRVSSLLSTPITSGSRNNSAASVCGALMQRFPPQDWEEKVWPLLVSWNATQAKPPLPEHELQTVFASIGQREMGRHTQEGGFADDTYIPLVEDTGDVIIVREKVNDGTATFAFSEIEQEKSREIVALVSIELRIPGQEPRPFTERVNILSHSAKEGLARALSKSFGKDIAWDLVVNHAATKVHDIIANRDDSQSFEEIPPQIGELYLLKPYIVDDGANVLFGMGSSGKTYVALRMAISVATGVDLLGEKPGRVGNVLYIDYEANGATLSSRLLRLLGDSALQNKPELSLDGLLTRFRYFKPPAPLPDCLPALKKMVKQHDIALIVIDSAVSACGGSPEDAVVASRYFNALNKLGIASLTISHVAKAQTEQQERYAFGSIFWHNFPRNTWNVKREEGEEEDGPIINVGLFHRKVNDDRKQKARALRLYFDPNRAFVEVGVGSIEAWTSEESTAKRIIRYLHQKPATLADIKEELPDLKINTVRIALKRLRSKGRVFHDNTSEMWGVVTHFADKQ